MTVTEQIKRILASTLQLGPRGEALNESSGLLGVIPEFDSMAVVSIITEIEETFGIAVEDDEIDAATFETVGSLSSFVSSKLDS